MPANYHMPPPNITMIGRFSLGRFGWFMPKDLIKSDQLHPPPIPYTIFKKNSGEQFDRFLFDTSVLKQLLVYILILNLLVEKFKINAISQINNINSSEFEAEYEPARCRDEKCVTLLSGHQEDTHFVRDHIDQWELYVKVVWLGENLRYVIQKLYDQNIKKSPAKQKSFIGLHWTPSEVIDVNIDYDSIAMPACKQFIEIDRNSMCKYELMPILMYCSKQLIEETHIKTVFEIISFDQRHERYLLQLYNNLTDVQRAKNADDNSIVSIEHAMNRADDMEGIYDEIACKFLTEISETNAEVQKLKQQIANLSKLEVFIGGIYPKKEEQENEHNG